MNFTEGVQFSSFSTFRTEIGVSFFTQDLYISVRSQWFPQQNRDPHW